MTQQVSVINAGAQGEHASQAVGRFNSALARHRPEVVLLMEGTNDLYGEGGNGAERAAAALEQMVASARAARVEVVLMTIPPQRNRGALVVDFNERIRSLAGRRDAVFADVHRVLLDGPCSGLSTIPCIGSDGLHPTAQGYELMAQELERVLVERYDVEIVPTAGEPRGAARGVVVSSAGTSVSRRRPG
jgi:acyl-CoA thioesterase-1